MGTNYYIKNKVCPTCKRAESEVHLGKSSGGWRFMFQYNGGKFYKTIAEMKKWLKDKTIEDEYGDIVPFKLFWNMVQSKQKSQREGGTSDGLIRLGEYDFYDREFS